MGKIEEPLYPTHYEGRVAWCPCGQALELAGLDPDNLKYAVRCCTCNKFVLIDETKRTPKPNQDSDPA